MRHCLSAALVLFWQRPRETRIEGVACSSDRADALSVLFNGNSHTFTNDLPKMLCRLASPERPLRVSSVVAPGWSLPNIGTMVTPSAQFVNGPFSYVVLQEHRDAAPARGVRAERTEVPLMRRAHSS